MNSRGCRVRDRHTKVSSRETLVPKHPLLRTSQLATHRVLRLESAQTTAASRPSTHRFSCPLVPAHARGLSFRLQQPRLALGSPRLHCRWGHRYLFVEVLALDVLCHRQVFLRRFQRLLSDSFLLCFGRHCSLYCTVLAHAPTLQHYMQRQCSIVQYLQITCTRARSSYCLPYMYKYGQCTIRKKATVECC